MACVMHWWPQGGGSGLGRGSSTARAARRPRSSPELGAWAPRARQGLLDLAQRDQGAREVLTGARNRVERPCRGGGVKGERRRRVRVRGGVVADGVRAPGLQRSTCDVPVKQNQGLARHGGRRRRGIATAAKLTRGEVRTQFRRCSGAGSVLRAWKGSLDRGEAVAWHGEICTAAGRRAHGSVEEWRHGGARRAVG